MRKTPRTEDEAKLFAATTRAVMWQIPKHLDKRSELRLNALIGSPVSSERIDLIMAGLGNK